MKWESEFKMDGGKFASSKSDNQSLAMESQEERKKAGRLQQLLQEATDRQIASEKQKEALQEQIDQVCRSGCHFGLTLK